MNFAHHTKHEANMVGSWPSYIIAFLLNAGEVEVNKDANKERGQICLGGFSHSDRNNLGE